MAMTTQTLPFDQWILKVLDRANFYVDPDYPALKLEDISPDAESWRDYYNDGYSPEDAWDEDISHA